MYDSLHAQLYPCHAVSITFVLRVVGLPPHLPLHLSRLPYRYTLPLSTLLHPLTTCPSPLVSPAEKTWIQRVVGSLLFYARALDLSILTAVCQLSSYQSNPTQLDLTAAHHLLNYVSSHPKPPKTFQPSSMTLWCCIDASFLSRPNSGSVAGCSVCLGDPPPYLLNPPPDSHRQSFRKTLSLIRVPRLIIQSCPSSPPPTPTTHNAPIHALFLSAHTPGGCVCGRGGVCRRFWWWTGVG